MVDTSPPQHRAVAFIQDADQFLRAAEIVDAETRSRLGVAPEMVAPIYSLLGHSMELTLKAFLLANGMTERELSKSGLRHSLSGLQGEATRRGFEAPGAFLTILGSLAYAHGSFAFRYRRNGRMLLPEVPEVCAALRPVVSTVDGIVRQSFKAMSSEDC